MSMLKSFVIKTQIHNIKELAIERGNQIKINAGRLLLSPELLSPDKEFLHSPYDCAQFLYINGCNLCDELLVHKTINAITDFDTEDTIQVMSTIRDFEVNEIIASYINYNGELNQDEKQRLKLYLNKKPYILSEAVAESIIEHTHQTIAKQYKHKQNQFLIDLNTMNTYLKIEQLNQKEIQDIINAAHMLMNPKNGYLWMNSNGTQRRLLDAIILTDANLQNKHTHIVLKIYRIALLKILSLTISL